VQVLRDLRGSRWELQLHTTAVLAQSHRNCSKKLAWMLIAKIENDLPSVLQALELSTFKEYIKKVKFAGINIMVVSYSADLLQIYYKVYVDALLFAPDGSLLSNPSSKPIEDVINQFIINLDFDGVFVPTKLTDEIQKIEGVNIPIFLSAQAKSGAFDYEAFVDFYQPISGYFKIDETFPLSTSIQYIVQ